MRQAGAKMTLRAPAIQPTDLGDASLSTGDAPKCMFPASGLLEYKQALLCEVAAIENFGLTDDPRFHSAGNLLLSLDWLLLDHADMCDCLVPLKAVPATPKTKNGGRI
jgi:hypothetical protein